jgi:hypothetical protein
MESLSDQIPVPFELVLHLELKEGAFIICPDGQRAACEPDYETLKEKLKSMRGQSLPEGFLREVSYSTTRKVYIAPTVAISWRVGLLAAGRKP